ncbi:MAG TPA: hypothetical protein VIL85_10040 [Thermomicrobiales bacterium]|jgi:hypothetical protein
MYQTDTSILARAVGAGVATALIVGVAWGLLNTAGLGRYGAVYDWGFWFTLLLGFGVAESISYLAKRRRGPNLQAIGIVCVLLGFIVSRVVINLRLPRPLTPDQILNQTIGVSQTLHINLLTLIFLGLACAIVWRRFR